MKPEQAAETSNAAAFSPSFFCTRHAVDGQVWSGVNVPTTTRSMSAGLMRAAREREAAFRAALPDGTLAVLEEAIRLLHAEARRQTAIAGQGRREPR